MPAYFWIIIAILLILAFFDVFGIVIALSIIRPRRRSLLETSILEEGKYPGIMEFYQIHLQETYRLKSRYGYELAIYYLKNQAATNKYLVMSHGHTYTHHGCLKYARMMMNHGYNIIIYDQRFHGDSGGKYTSLGYFEKDDLHDIITDTYSRFGDNIELGLYGESMGAATVILESAEDNRVAYVFADCGYTDLNTLIKQLMDKNLPWPLKRIVFPVRVAFRILTGIGISSISPKDALATLHVPVFFAHGEADNLISYEHTLKMYEAYQGDKSLFIADNGARHAEGYLKDTDKYEHAINEFMNNKIHKK